MAAVSGNNTITTLERLKAMPGVFVQTIKQGRSIWFAIGELVDLITGKADKPITGTDVPTDPPAYEGQICSVSKNGFPNILVGVKVGGELVWRQVAISSSNGLPKFNNIIIGGSSNVVDPSSSPYGGIFCGSGNKVSNYACICVGGGNCHASGSQSATLGGAGNEASGYISVCVGGSSGNKASGAYSVTFGGSGNKASSDYSVTLGGTGNETSGSFSAALGGQNCKASSNFSVTIGGSTCNAGGAFSATLAGSGCEAGGDCSLTLGGAGCKTTQNYQVAMGKYNDPTQDNNNVLFMVGGGESNTERANVFTISKTGVPKAMAGQYNVPCCKTGITAPSTAPDYVGQEYLDAAQKKVYKAFGTTDASDWVALN